MILIKLRERLKHMPGINDFIEGLAMIVEYEKIGINLTDSEKPSKAINLDLIPEDQYLFWVYIENEIIKQDIRDNEKPSLKEILICKQFLNQKSHLASLGYDFTKN